MKQLKKRKATVVSLKSILIPKFELGVFLLLSKLHNYLEPALNSPSPLHFNQFLYSLRIVSIIELPMKTPTEFNLADILSYSVSAYVLENANGPLQMSPYSYFLT